MNTLVYSKFALKGSVALGLKGFVASKSAPNLEPNVRFYSFFLKCSAYNIHLNYKNQKLNFWMEITVFTNFKSLFLTRNISKEFSSPRLI